MQPPLSVQLTENPTAKELEAIGQGLNEFNQDVTGGTERQALYVLLRDDSGQIVGGLVASTSWQWLHVSLLWVAESERGRGCGAALLAMAEQEAMRRGCIGAYLNTFSFQAPEFYQKQGYTVFGELPDFPPGHTRYFLRKQLSNA